MPDCLSGWSYMLLIRSSWQIKRAREQVSERREEGSRGQAGWGREGEILAGHVEHLLRAAPIKSNKQLPHVLYTFLMGRHFVQLEEEKTCPHVHLFFWCTHCQLLWTRSRKLTKLSYRLSPYSACRQIIYKKKKMNKILKIKCSSSWEHECAFKVILQEDSGICCEEVDISASWWH